MWFKDSALPFCFVGCWHPPDQNVDPSNSEVTFMPIFSHDDVEDSLLLKAGQASLGSLDAAEIASRSLRVAQSMMKQYRLLNAEAILAQAVQELRRRGDYQVLRRLCNAAVFKQVVDLIGRYEQVGRVLDSLALYDQQVQDDVYLGKHAAGNLGGHADFVCIWEGKDARLFGCESADDCTFKTRLVAEIDAPLRHIFVALNELDLQPQWQSSLSEAPECIGAKTRFRHVQRTRANILMLTVESIVSVLRVANKEFGSVVELITSDVPAESLNIEECSWWSQRIGLNTSTIWLPRGGGSGGIVIVQDAEVQVGCLMPQYILHRVLAESAQQMLQELRDVCRVIHGCQCDLGERLQERLHLDETGLYSELAAVEAAAACRPEVRMFQLPGREAFRRECSLTQLESSRTGPAVSLQAPWPQAFLRACSYRPPHRFGAGSTAPVLLGNGTQVTDCLKAL